MDFSVVVASVDAELSIQLCLQRLETACAGLRSEVLVCDASNDRTVDRAATVGAAATLVRFPAGTLTPTLWAEGLRRSSGRIVAFTTGHCLVSSTWARSLIDAIDAGATGAGGPLVIAPGARPLDWAVFYLRYSAFMPETIGSGPVTGEIAGDNAAYSREALDRHAASFTNGFWEVDFHSLIRRDGGSLVVAPAATAAFGRSFPLRTIVAHRFAHGRQFGAGRVRGGTRAVWQIVLAAPVVPFVLAARAARRVTDTADGRWRFVVALPWFMLLAAAWAAGEAWGALKGTGE
jgi:hypothetical protein